MSLDANNLDDKKIDTSGLTSLLRKKPDNKQEEKERVVSSEANGIPETKKANRAATSSKGKTKSSTQVRTPFDGPSQEDLKRVSDRIANQVSKNQLSPTRLAQLSMLKQLCDSDGLIRKSQREIAVHLGFKDKKATSKVIKFFCDKGKIKVIKQFDARKQTPAVYRVLD